MNGQPIPMTLFPSLDQDAATLSDCGQYRYTLRRSWGPGPTAVWIMLNPSTADGLQDDATIRRCTAFARSWRCGALSVVNLYAWRATNPQELRVKGRDVIGPENDQVIRAAVTDAARNGWPVIAAWGANAATERIHDVVRITERAGAVLQCLGTTKAGHPRHPLFVPTSTARRPLNGATMCRPSRVRVTGDLFHGRVPEGAVYVGRAAPGLSASPYANPHRVGLCRRCGATHDRPAAVAAYTRDLTNDPTQVAGLRWDLAGVDLACWCRLDEACHADVLLKAANPEPTEPTEGQR